MGVIVYNGLSSEDYGILVEHPPVYQVPEKDYEAIHIEGRNGDIIVDKGGYQNVERSYDIAFANIEHGYEQETAKVAEWLCSSRGYNRLEDSYDKDHYRLAYLQDSVDFSNLFGKAGEGTITFNCKPQRFLKSGEKVFKVPNDGIIVNPTIFESEPVFLIYGHLPPAASTTYRDSYGLNIVQNGKTLHTAYVRISNKTVSSKGFPEYFLLDCSGKFCLGSNGRSYNSETIITNGFPKLPGGKFQITVVGENVDAVYVIPNWWRI